MHVNVSRLQCCDVAQSPSAQQLPVACGIHTPLTPQVCDWQTVAFAALQPDWPAASPHFPLVPQAFTTHWLATAQSPPFGAAQVLAASLQRRDTHTASAFTPPQRPSWSPSVGIAMPGSRSAAHVNARWLQCWPARQSASSQQPSAGMHAPLAAEQIPDWQRVAAFRAVHPGSPFAAPHLAFVPHVLTVHWAGAVQTATLAEAQVFAVALQRPVTQAALTAAAVHVLCTESNGRAVPDGSFAVQVNVLRAQKSLVAQSPST